jgi:hypothetical protein
MEDQKADFGIFFPAFQKEVFGKYLALKIHERKSSLNL